MQTTTLGPLTVSRLCLGAMLMGAETPAGEAHRMLDWFREAGGTFIDTADTYGDGGSERTLAPWLARHRDEVVIATKVRFAVSDPGGEGLSPGRIRAACDASLRRLGIDVIDLYQVHGPDPAVPIEDTLAGRTLRRTRPAAVLPGRRARCAAVGSARRRLPHRPVHA